jgi:outer membrane lipoprotein SlyB
MNTKTYERDTEESANRDPITGAPGAHPVGTGVGAAAGGVAGVAAAVAAGAAAGTVVGPVGTVIGAAAGAIIGGLAGKGVAEMVDPTVEVAYWKDNYANRPYVQQGVGYDEYAPAYRYGIEAYQKSPARTLDDIEGDLAADWHDARGTSALSWDDAREPARDSFERIRNNSAAARR